MYLVSVTEEFQTLNSPISALIMEIKKYVRAAVETIKDFLAEDFRELKVGKVNIVVLYHLFTSQNLMLQNNVMNRMHQDSGKLLLYIYEQ